MKKIIFFTRAYNAEKTLESAINSVLDQTYKNLVYYILDNASTDGTSAIIEAYAKKDSRVIPLRNNINDVVINDINDSRAINLCSAIEMVISTYSEDSLFCVLDADDKYCPDFSEKMLGFMEENNLDVVSCRSDHINVRTYASLNKVVLKENIVVAENEFDEKFQDYFRYIGSHWGKLFSLKTLRKANFRENAELIRKLTYSADTVICLEIIQNAERIGILAEPLHKYYIYEKSESSINLLKRYESNRIMVDVYRNFLIKKTGLVSEQSESYVHGIYLRSIRNTSLAVMGSDWSGEDKLLAIRNAVAHEFTLKMLDSKNTSEEDKKNFVSSMLDIIGEYAQEQEQTCGELKNLLCKY